MDEERLVVRFLNYAGDDLLGVVEIEYGGNALPLAPTPEIIQGKTFKGWNADITHVTEDMTVRPVYEDQTFTVRFLNYAGTDFTSSAMTNLAGFTIPRFNNTLTAVFLIDLCQLLYRKLEWKFDNPWAFARTITSDKGFFFLGADSAGKLSREVAFKVKCRVI